jgi:hypothetical protein
MDGDGAGARDGDVDGGAGGQRRVLLGGCHRQNFSHLRGIPAPPLVTQMPLKSQSLGVRGMRRW